MKKQQTKTTNAKMKMWYFVISKFNWNEYMNDTHARHICLNKSYRFDLLNFVCVILIDNSFCGDHLYLDAF